MAESSAVTPCIRNLTAGTLVASDRRRRRSGFSLVEILLTVVIIALLTAVVVPTVMGRINSARGDAIIAEMQSLQNGILLYYRDIGRYPSTLEQLNGIVAGDVDACGTPLPSTAAGKYRGPYINKQINILDPPPAPINTRYQLATDDSIDTVLTWTTVTTTGTQQVLQILAYGPEQKIVEDMDMKVDGTLNGAGGIIHYVGNPQPNEYIVKWTIPIKLNAC